MEPIVSGTTTERMIRTLLIALLACGYSAWSLWDGYVAYPRANVESAIRDKIGAAVPSPVPAIDPTLTSLSVSERLRRTTAGDSSDGFGSASLSHGGKQYYFGHGGYVEAEAAGGRLTKAQWNDGPKHSAADLAFQRVIGFGLAPVGLVLLIQFVRALFTRAELSDAGLKLRGRALIPFDQIRSVRSSKPGVHEVVYEWNGRERVVRLDDFVLKAAPEMVRTIRERCGGVESGFSDAPR